MIRRARGELITPSTWIRNQVINHPKYNQNSIVSHEIAYDVMMSAKALGEGNIQCPELLGEIIIANVRPEDAYQKQSAGRLTSTQRSEL